MKTILFALTTLLLIPSCSDDNFDFTAPDPVKFVTMVKNGAYDYHEVNDTGNLLWLKMPVFTEKDIPALLALAADTTHIQAFPENPISSIRQKRLILGECLLWTIEGIRIGRAYGSLSPSLIIRDKSFNNVRYLTGEEVLDVYQIYVEWWEKVKGDKFLMRQINPLKDTIYHWL